MEVGAVKQAFNNELIKLKKNFNQAKIQIIHKLTRKAKTLSQKKAPEKLQEKLRRKSELALKEVFIIKKIKVRDLAKFMLTHKGDLKSQLNMSAVDSDKAYARLLLHKSLNDRYNFIRHTFRSVPINDLLMSRQERRTLKKEARENKKNKQKGLNNNLEKNMPKALTEVELHSEESDHSEDSDDRSLEQSNTEALNIEQGTMPSIIWDDSVETNKIDWDTEFDKKADELPFVDSKCDTKIVPGKFVNSCTAEEKSKPAVSKIKKPIAKSLDDMKNPVRDEVTVIRKVKHNKNKNLNQKLLSRKFEKEADFVAQENKIVDPFFITDTGESYLSVSEPRKPDEIKEVHKQGNRKHRRAAMFGRALPCRPRKDKNKSNDNSEYNQERYRININNLSSTDGSTKTNVHSQSRFLNNKYEEDKPETKVEKLHPSWEAKKKFSSMLPFQGKKIVFNDG